MVEADRHHFARCLDRSLHALCRFFLDATGPRHDTGSRASLPFVLNMATLFEMFVAEWLVKHLLPDRYLRYQHPLQLGVESGLDFRIDMVLFEEGRTMPLRVLDAKYRVPDKVAADDFNQVVVYANGMKCNEAFLVYPRPLKQPLDVRLDDIRVRSLAFPLDGDLDQAGEGLLRVLRTLDVQTLD